MRDPRTVAVGLDVHESSVRLAAVRAGEVLREVMLPFDHLVGLAAPGHPAPAAMKSLLAAPGALEHGLNP